MLILKMRQPVPHGILVWRIGKIDPMPASMLLFHFIVDGLVFAAPRPSLTPAEKDILVAAAACTKLLSRGFNSKQDFIHSQGEILMSNARCHVLVDCDYHDSQPDPKNTSLYLYKVVRKEASLLVLQCL